MEWGKTKRKNFVIKEVTKEHICAIIVLLVHVRRAD